MTDDPRAPSPGAQDPADLAFDPDALRAKYREEREKRLRADGNEQYREVKGELARFVEDPYVEPGFAREPLFDEVLREPGPGRCGARGLPGCLAGLTKFAIREGLTSAEE